MQLSDVMEGMHRDGDDVVANVGEEWLQGRSVFGGLQAAIAVAAMRTQVDAALPLRTLQVTFVAPVPAGDVRARAVVLRRGGSATQVEARIVAGDQVLLLAVGIFGSARASVVRHAPAAPGAAGDGDLRMPWVPGITPAFTQQFDARWRSGGLPFSGTPAREHVIELALKDRGPVTESHVLAFADFAPPVALSMLSKVAPGSSMTWMLDFLRTDFAALPLSGWRVDARLDAAADGYTSQSLLVSAPDGSPVALGSQNMVVFG